MGEEELKKLEELRQMGFIGENEYQQRKEDILQAYPHLSSHSSPSLSPQNLDLTAEDKTSAEPVRLNGAFEELRKTPSPSLQMVYTPEDAVLFFAALPSPLEHVQLEQVKKAAPAPKQEKKEEEKKEEKKEEVKPVVHEEKKEEKKVEKKEDDDVDLFGDDEDDKEYEEELQRRKEAAIAAKGGSKKVAVTAKSSLLIDVKPWDDETPMDKLEECVRSIQMEGLLWGASKLVPVAFQIKKLQINAVVVDDLVSIDDVEEKILAFEDYIQSMDIAAFNKI